MARAWPASCAAAVASSGAVKARARGSPPRSRVTASCRSACSIRSASRRQATSAASSSACATDAVGSPARRAATDARVDVGGERERRRVALQERVTLLRVELAERDGSPEAPRMTERRIDLVQADVGREHEQGMDVPCRPVEADEQVLDEAVGAIVRATPGSLTIADTDHVIGFVDEHDGRLAGGHRQHCCQEVLARGIVEVGAGERIERAAGLGGEGVGGGGLAGPRRTDEQQPAAARGSTQAAQRPGVRPQAHDRAQLASNLVETHQAGRRELTRGCCRRASITRPPPDLLETFISAHPL